MIILTKIDGNKITVNADEIETIETSHDSIISLKSGKKILVKESSQEIIALVIEYRRKCYSKSDEIAP
ncbi:MAG TPA: flagellar FlbD family protein [Candidatus Kapabacteria bacterium]|jgi:flagellar protein FlbD|nr:flagellar FlbD family protein [Candidatus Kapabacteria bacterium]HPP40395.1 flagellar FlbD family protein [Candidatus Kapabacteria bacterium]HPU22799.1 flagellar FlbD family protein [Candidatus Kapabacteria bacterium]